MTSFKFHFKASQKGGSEKGHLLIRIIHQRKIACISTGYTLYPHEWDQQAQTVHIPALHSQRKEELIHIKKAIANDLHQLSTLRQSLEATGGYTAKEIAGAFKKAHQGEMLKTYGALLKEKLEQNGHARTARAYASAVKSLQQFMKGKDIYLKDIQAQLIINYENYLIHKGVKLNTISFYMRNLRAIYNRAIQDKLIQPQEESPFTKVFTGVAESKKRTLEHTELIRLANIEQLLETYPGQTGCSTPIRPQLYRNLQKALYYFLFCYHARGMSFIDLCFLKKTDIHENTIVYRRKKTGGLLKVRITPPMAKIIAFFQPQTGTSHYLFPILGQPATNERKQYETALTRQNVHLQMLSQLAGLDKKVTTHVSRHTWATLAKRAKVPIPLISEALGHKDIQTTNRYLASFEVSVLDELSIQMSGLVPISRSEIS